MIVMGTENIEVDKARQANNKVPLLCIDNTTLKGQDRVGVNKQDQIAAFNLFTVHCTIVFAVD